MTMGLFTLMKRYEKSQGTSIHPYEEEADIAARLLFPSIRKSAICHWGGCVIDGTAQNNLKVLGILTRTLNPSSAPGRIRGDLSAYSVG
jgi:hypothetical protein